MADADDLSRRIERERPYLLRYASLQLRDREVAEDVVQDTLLAALQGGGGFDGRSKLRTWLTGILKHKIIDVLRRVKREPVVPLPADENGDTDFDSLFADRGHWSVPPAAWTDPDASLEQREFFVTLEACLSGLPEKTAEAFVMREHLGLDTDEICKALGITSTHCWVLLYRARMALRLCIEKNWFGAGPARLAGTSARD